MSYAALSPLMALLLALSMFLSPAANMGEAGADLPHATLSLDYTENHGDFSVGLVETTDGQDAFYVTLEEGSFYLTGTTAMLEHDGQLISVPAAELTALAYGALGMLPAPTEEDAMAVAWFAQALMDSVTGKSLSLLPMDNGVYVILNVDQLIAELDQAIPQVLTAYAEYLDPTIIKYSTALLGQSITSAELAEVWPELGLSELQTGLVLHATVQQQSNGSTFISATAADVNLSCTVSRDSFDMQITLPDGKVYPFSTADLLTVVQLLASVPAPTTAAFNAVETSGTNAFGETTSNIVLTLDTTVMARDLNAGLAQVVADNAATVDALLNKYRSWFELIDPELAAFLTAENLASAFQQGLLSLPEIKGEAVLTSHRGGSITVDGHFTGFFGKATLTGSICTGWGNDISLTLTIDDGYDPLVLTYAQAADVWSKQVSITSSNPIFDLFRIISLHMDDNGFVLTTDTNDLRLAYDAEEQYMEAKIGLLSASLREDENEDVHVNLSLPEFFLDLHIGGEALALDSTFFGLDYTETDSGPVIGGYIRPDLYDDSTFFGLAVDEYTGVVQAYLKGEDVDVQLNIAENVISFSDGDDLVTLIPDYAREAYVLSFNGEEHITITGEEENDALTLHFFDGLDTEVAPAFTVTLDMSPAAINLPEGAQAVDARTFLMALLKLFN